MDGGSLTREHEVAQESMGRIVDITIYLKNIFDLIRYVYPNPPVPKKFRRNLIGIGAGDPTKAICSSLIAEAFKEIDHPILPFKGKLQSLIMRHPSFCLPKDFDISPFFKVIKPSPQNSY